MLIVKMVGIKDGGGWNPPEGTERICVGAG